MYSQLTVPHCYRTSQILSLQVYPHLPYLFEKVLPGYSFSPTLLQLPYLSVSVHTSCRAKLTQLHFRETSHSQPVQPDKKISTHIVLMFSRRWPRRRRCRQRQWHTRRIGGERDDGRVAPASVCTETMLISSPTDMRLVACCHLSRPKVHENAHDTDCMLDSQKLDHHHQTPPKHFELALRVLLSSITSTSGFFRCLQFEN